MTRGQIVGTLVFVASTVWLIWRAVVESRIPDPVDLSGYVAKTSPILIPFPPPGLDERDETIRFEGPA